jgi:ABC-2 type transport system permease protein
MNFFLIYKKELLSYFDSFMAYIACATFLLLSGYFFYTDVVYFDTFLTIRGINIAEGLMRQFFHDLNLVMLPIIPLFTMRLFAEEKKMGTIELLFTSPIKDWEIILGKFFACLSVITIVLALTLLYQVQIMTIWKIEIGPLISGYLGLFLMGCCFISLGILVSSLTDNQLIAAMITFGLLLFFYVIAFNAGMGSRLIENILLHLSFLEHFDTFARGVIDTKSIIHSLCFILFFLYLNLQSLQSRRWMGLR